AAQPGDRRVRAEEGLRGELAEGHDDRRANRVQLCLEERLAGLDLVRLGIAVPRRPALHHVADVDLVARVAHRGDHLGEELAGGPDEGNALVVLLGSGALSHEDQARLRIADAEDDVLPARAELAALAVSERATDLVQAGWLLHLRGADGRGRDDG